MRERERGRVRAQEERAREQHGRKTYIPRDLQSQLVPEGPHDAKARDAQRDQNKNKKTKTKRKKEGSNVSIFFHAEEEAACWSDATVDRRGNSASGILGAAGVDLQHIQQSTRLVVDEMLCRILAFYPHTKHFLLQP